MDDTRDIPDAFDCRQQRYGRPRHIVVIARDPNDTKICRRREVFD